MVRAPRPPRRAAPPAAPRPARPLEGRARGGTRRVQSVRGEGRGVSSQYGREGRGGLWRVGSPRLQRLSRREDGPASETPRGPASGVGLALGRRARFLQGRQRLLTRVRGRGATTPACRWQRVAGTAGGGRWRGAVRCVAGSACGRKSVPAGVSLQALSRPIPHTPRHTTPHAPCPAPRRGGLARRRAADPCALTAPKAGGPRLHRAEHTTLQAPQ
jgi:hypothetical protein